MRKKFWISLIGLCVFSVANYFLFFPALSWLLHIAQLLLLLTNLFLIMHVMTNEKQVLPQDKIPSILVAIVAANFIDRLARNIALNYLDMEEIHIKYLVLGSLLIFLLLSWLLLRYLKKLNTTV